jgi:hypothetical protein
MTKPQPVTPTRGSPLLALLAVATAFALSACGNSNHYQPRPASYDDNMYASALCVDQHGIRVPDAYCPIGDGAMNAGYGWRYHSYLASDPYTDVVYVGYPVGTTYVTTRPARVSTIHIDRGRFPDRAPAGVKASDVRVPSLSTVQRNPAIQRGGFGAPGAKAAGTPLPSRSLNSPAPGRTFAAPAPPPPPPAARSMSSSSVGSYSSGGGFKSSGGSSFKSGK